MIWVDEKKILELFSKAFDDGYYGYCDLKESSSQKLLDELIEDSKKHNEPRLIVPNLPELSLEQTTFTVPNAYISNTIVSGGNTISINPRS
jgi:hypothetical protein